MLHYSPLRRSLGILLNNRHSSCDLHNGQDGIWHHVAGARAGGHQAGGHQAGGLPSQWPLNTNSPRSPGISLHLLPVTRCNLGHSPASAPRPGTRSGSADGTQRHRACTTRGTSFLTVWGSVGVEGVVTRGCVPPSSSTRSRLCTELTGSSRSCRGHVLTQPHNKPALFPLLLR